MKILILNWRDPEHPLAGGAEGYLLQIGRRWVRAGHRVTWLCGRHPGQSASAELEGIRIRRRGLGYAVFFAAAAEYLRFLRHEVDFVVDGENGIPFFSPFYCRAPKIVLVHHVHREVFHHELPAVAAHVANLLEGRLMPWAYRRDTFVAVSESTRRELVELGVEQRRLAVIHNGLDHTRFRPGEKSHRPEILWLGRLRRYKSVDTVLEAAARWRAEVPGARLIIAGDGPERQRLEAKSNALGLGDSVQFLGFVDPQEKVRLMQRAHLVVQTSMKEGWGMTVIEANACGTAVVASDVAGLRDSVRDGATGRLVPWNDPTALAENVIELLHAPGERRRLESAAVRWASQFDWQSCAGRWLEIIEARRAGCIVPAPLRHDLP